MLVKLPEFKPASAANVLQGFTDKLLGIAQPMRLSMTYDQGMEMHAQGAQRANRHSGVLLRPAQPLAKDSNQNMNGLMCQNLPKGTDLSIYSQEQLASFLNGNARKLQNCWA